MSDKNQAKSVTRRMILSPVRPVYEGGRNWLGHGARGGKNAEIDNLLLHGATMRELLQLRNTGASIRSHFRSLKLSHDLRVTRGSDGKYKFDRTHLGIPEDATESDDHSANTTVLATDKDELMRSARRAEYDWREFSKSERNLAEIAYPRATPASLKLILPKHRTLSREFCDWLENQHSIEGYSEIAQIDMRFKIGRKSAMAELKIAYDGNTKAAVREALGQIFEYNYYPGREPAEAWFLILDRKPSEKDGGFVNSLRTKWGCPIFLGWKQRVGFTFHPRSPLG